MSSQERAVSLDDGWRRCYFERNAGILREKNEMKLRLDRKKWFAAACVLVFLAGLVPVLYLTGYVHATGDDFGYGALTHAAWLDTHSLLEVFRAACETVRNYYTGWQGTWFSVFLFTFQPEVFSPDAYWIVPLLMLGLTIVGVSIAGYYFLVRKAGFSWSGFIALDALVLFILIQFVPSTKSAIFWYNGTAHYVVPFFLALVAVSASGMFMDTGKWRFFIISFICMVFLGGASYLAALFAPIVIVFLWLLYGRKKRRSLWLVLPIAAEMIGLVVSLLAPGNTVRGGEDLGVSAVRVAAVIMESFRQGVLTMGEYLTEKPVMFLIMIPLAFLIWEELNEQREKTACSFAYRFPGLFLAAMFCIYCAMFAPGLYAGTELSGGVPNTIFQVFVLTMTASCVYLLGWVHARWIKLRNEKDGSGIAASEKRWYVAGAVATVLFLGGGVFLCRSTVRDTTFFLCVDYIISGQADDYKAQMEERQEILLDETVLEAELPAMNQDQGPLMHMEVTEDPESWTNRVVRDFYRKNSVVEIERVQ